ncbi:hypothetical protein SynBMKMC1_01738 [Synechococcus sp. BMK-MC-1]|nr:hypothetical protein SynBMKMC1_01738 [Synechococcus sp. BMK-MC-1]
MPTIWRSSGSSSTTQIIEERPTVVSPARDALIVWMHQHPVAQGLTLSQLISVLSPLRHSLASGCS